MGRTMVLSCGKCGRILESDIILVVLDTLGTAHEYMCLGCDTSILLAEVNEGDEKDVLIAYCYRSPAIRRKYHAR